MREEEIESNDITRVRRAQISKSGREANLVKGKSPSNEWEQ